MPPSWSQDQVGVRVDFGLALDLGPLRQGLVERLGADRVADLAQDGRVIGLRAAVRRAVERLLARRRDGRPSLNRPASQGSLDAGGRTPVVGAAIGEREPARAPIDPALVGGTGGIPPAGAARHSAPTRPPAGVGA